MRFDKQTPREAFEEWAKSLNLDLESSTYQVGTRYVNTYVAAAWIAWEASWQVAMSQRIYVCVPFGPWSRVLPSFKVFSSYEKAEKYSDESFDEGIDGRDAIGVKIYGAIVDV